MDKNEKKSVKSQYKDEIKKQKIADKEISLEYKGKLKEAKLKVKEEIKNRPKDYKKIKKIEKSLEKSNYEITWYFKFAIIFATVVAIIESILFIPLAWTIWYFNRIKPFYKGESIDNRVKIGINALIFYGIIPGIIILSCKPKENLKSEETK